MTRGPRVKDRPNDHNREPPTILFVQCLAPTGGINKKLRVLRPGTVEQRCAYLDIETTSLAPEHGDLTVVGLFLDDAREETFIQLVGDEISAPRLLALLRNSDVLYTYNGSRFDLPYIKAKLGVDLTQCLLHRDLMYDCWKNDLYGGLKGVERQLGIERASAGIDGRIAVQLWLHYRHYGDETALLTLLKYNREDVTNLRVLRQKLKV